MRYNNKTEFENSHMLEGLSSKGINSYDAGIPIAIIAIHDDILSRLISLDFNRFNITN